MQLSMGTSRGRVKGIYGLLNLILFINLLWICTACFIIYNYLLLYFILRPHFEVTNIRPLQSKDTLILSYIEKPYFRASKCNFIPVTSWILSQFFCNNIYELFYCLNNIIRGQVGRVGTTSADGSVTLVQARLLVK